MSIQVTDQTGEVISLNQPAKRIVSVVPSQTELLCYLGLENQLLGITKFCVHPRAVFKKKEKVGGTKKLKIDRIKALEPDLIIANKEENTKEDILELKKYFKVYISDILTLEDNHKMIRDLGTLTDTTKKAAELIDKIQYNFSAFKDKVKTPYASVVYFIWKKPMMVVGGKNIINTMLKEAGLKNIFSGLERYPAISENDLIEAKPKIILLSSEPFPFKEKHAKEFQEFLPKAKYILVDGEMFSWYGNHLLHSTAYFLKLKKVIETALQSPKYIFQV